MRALIQRVQRASVQVDGQIVGEIGTGMLAYIGIGRDDDLQKAKKLIDKLLSYRIFENTSDSAKLGKLDKSLTDIAGDLLLVSQFTLMANTANGRRPDFSAAMPPKDAVLLFDALIAYTQETYPAGRIATGQFGANMQVSACNDGPINLIIDV